MVLSRHGLFEVHRRIGNVHTMPYAVVDTRTHQMVSFAKTQEAARRIARFKNFQESKPARPRKKRGRA